MQSPALVGREPEVWQYGFDDVEKSDVALANIDANSAFSCSAFVKRPSTVWMFLKSGSWRRECGRPMR